MKKRIPHLEAYDVHHVWYFMYWGQSFYTGVLISP